MITVTDSELERRYNELIFQRNELLKLLKEVEWIDREGSGKPFWQQCPWCGAFKKAGYHKDYCRYTALLQRIEDANRH